MPILGWDEESSVTHKIRVVMLVEMGFTGDTRVYYCTVCLHLVEETIYLIKLYIHSERVLFFFHWVSLLFLTRDSVHAHVHGARINYVALFNVPSCTAKTHLAQHLLSATVIILPKILTFIISYIYGSQCPKGRGLLTLLPTCLSLQPVKVK